MFQTFSFELPRGIFFGPEQRKMLAELIEPFGSRVLLMCGSTWFKSSGWKAKFDEILKDFNVINIECPTGEPTVASVTDIQKEVEELDCDAVVAVGGGSVLDTAKAVAALLPTGDRVEDYLEGIGSGKQLQAPGLPWLALPTTSGTGTEVTRNAVIRSIERGFKKSLRSRHAIATYAIVDPELTLDLPSRITGLSGMDALTQLIEAYVSKKSRPFPKALVKDAFPTMLRALEVLSGNPRDLDARTGAAYGALVSGVALANSGLGAVHGFASGLGGMFDIPHGLICASLLIPVLRMNGSIIQNDIAELVATVEGVAPKKPVEWLIGKTADLMESFELTGAIKAYKVPQEQVAEIAKRSTGSSMSGNPRELSQSEKEDILNSVL